MSSRVCSQDPDMEYPESLICAKRHRSSRMEP